MEKFGKGNKNSEKSKGVPDKKGAFSDASDGSMDYLSKTDGFESKDAGKVRKGEYKDSRYK